MKRYFDSKELPTTDVFPMTPGKCRLCSTPLKGKQQSWCSEKCSGAAFNETMLRRGSQQYMRIALRKRDAEICGQCGLDTKQLHRVLRSAVESLQELFRHLNRSSFDAERSIYSLFGWHPWRHLWEADHIVEVAAGGQHHLDNLQTLCIKCHKAKTKRFVSKKTAQETLF